MRAGYLGFPNVNGGVWGVCELGEEDQVFAVVFCGGVWRGFEWVCGDLGWKYCLGDTWCVLDGCFGYLVGLDFAVSVKKDYLGPCRKCQRVPMVFTTPYLLKCIFYKVFRIKKYPCI